MLSLTFLTLKVRSLILSIFFNKTDGSKNLVMVEFKSPNADLDEKNKSLSELPDDRPRRDGPGGE